MSVELWVSFAVASALIIAVPGPTVLLLIARTLERGPASALPVLLGTTRKYAVPFLEWADKEGLTIRRGDLRHVR